jgi:cleavage and polyadenylation specificity factor subunit 2
MNASRSNAPPEPWPFPLCLVSKNAEDMLNFTRSLLEWMGGYVRETDERALRGNQRWPQNKSGGGIDHNPLDLR